MSFPQSIILHPGRARMPKWLASDKREQAAWSLAMEAIVSGASRSGNSQDAVGLGVGVGRAVATVADRPVWGGLNFLSGDCLLAEYDSEQKEFWLKDSAADRTPGMKPWRLKGETKNIRLAKPNETLVVRSAKVGTGQFDEHVAMRTNLTAHHLSPRPPENSTLVSDPGNGGDDEREAGLHGIMRVRKFARSFCGKYADSNQEPFYSLLLNFTKSAGDNSGYGAAHFGGAEALLSYLGGGPLRRSNADHLKGFGEAPIEQAALDLNALWGTEGTLFSPAEFIREPWAPGAKGPFVVAVEWREDFAAKHRNHCGKLVDGTKKWMSWKDKERLPTTPQVPPPFDDPPPVDDPPTTGPPVAPPVYPAHQYTPWEPTPTNSGPAEDEAPSYRGSSTPDIPEGPVPKSSGETSTPDGSNGTDGGVEDDGTGYGGGTPVPRGLFGILTPQEVTRRERDRYWLANYGFTEKQFYSEPRLTEIAFVPQYEFTTPKTGPTKWLPKLRNPAVLHEDDTGKIIAREAAHGPGGAVVMPGLLEPWHALRIQWGHRAPVDTPASSFTLLNYKMGGGALDPEVITRLGLGARHLNSPYVASGAEHKLTYDGAGGYTTPDYNITPKDTTGADDLLGAGNAALRIYHHLQPENEITLGTSVDIAAGDNVSASLATIVRITSGTAFTGIVAPVPSRKRIIWLMNRSGAEVTISHDVTSTAANRFYCPGSTNFALADNAGITLYYDTTVSRWCFVDGSGGGTSGGGVTGAARAYLSGADQAYTTGSPAKIQFNAETFDVEGWFDSATNYRYTPLEAGKYRISARCRSNAALTTDNPVVIIYKNGSEYARGNSGEGGGGRSGSVVDSTVDMNGTTDYLEIYFNSGANCTIYLGSAETYVDVERLDLPAVATFTDAPSDGLTYGRKDAAWEALPRRTVTVQFGGPGGSITAGDTAWTRVPFDCTINKVTLLGDATGSIVVDVWKDVYANYPPTVADTIAAAAKPTLSAAAKSEDSTLTGWTTTVTSGDIIKFNVDSVSGLTHVALILEVTPT